MPILKLNGKGEVFDPNMGEAPLVSENDVYELSAKKNPALEKAKIKAEALERNEIVRQFQEKMVQAAIEKARMDAAEWARGLKEQATELAQTELNEIESDQLMWAIQTGKRRIEKMSGVTGDGLFVSGDNALIDYPSTDWIEEVPAPAPQDFGSTGTGTVPTDTWPKPIDNTRYFAIVPKSPYLAMKASATPIAGEFTTYHKFLIEQWRSNSYVYEYQNQVAVKDASGQLVKDEIRGGNLFEPNKSQSVQKRIVDQDLKKHIWDKAESFLTSTYTGKDEMMKSAQRGWMWSGYFDEMGNWVQLKVPFVYGLPMDCPEIRDDEDSRRKLLQYRHSYLYNHWESSMLFNSFEELIKAYAYYYKYIQGEIDWTEQERRKMEIQTPTQAKEVAKEEAKAVETKPSVYDFRHPMAIKGLV
jgi:hypothetical protein